MKSSFLLWPILFLLSISACTPKKNLGSPQTVVSSSLSVEKEEIEERTLEEVEVVSSKPQTIEEVQAKFPVKTYRSSADRLFDLLHTRLEVSFDWENQYVLGKATLDLTPYFYPQDELVLDAKNFDIKEIHLANSSQSLDYKYDGNQLRIQLAKTYKKGENLSLFIEYVAKPNEGPVGGSAAISMDKGLYFINPTNSVEGKPQQIWTQGETESNSRWFPTIDKPNERCTQEIYVTVEDRFTTLSNGLLMSSKKNSDGTRTDYWKMDIPHAPYLFMLAIGEYAVVKEKWENIELGYYVEPEYQPYAKDIFAHTPEMLSFFSKLTGVKYPWPKYAQAVVRDYVSGAMENTTASIFGEFVQKTDRQLIDNSNESIVAHELFHHWFGDYVTCEGWSNLTINEGFATYSEYLWKENKYGRDAAEYHRLNSLRGYVSSTKNMGTRPIIDHYYGNKENMFDAHSYNKGALVLHMLRQQIGEEAFFEGIQKFLKTRALKSAEIDDLRLIYEEITGRDLGLFFNQWLKSAGHPILEVKTTYDAPGSRVLITVEQVQNPEENLAVFQFPLIVSVQTTTMTEQIVQTLEVNQRKQEFEIRVPSNYHFVRIDTTHTLLAEINRSLSVEELIYQFENYKDFNDRFSALNKLSGNYSPEVQKVFSDALEDPFWAIRSKALGEVSITGNERLIAKVKEMAKMDAHASVRAKALKILGDLEDEDFLEIFHDRALDEKESFVVVNAAIEALQKIDQSTAEKMADLFVNVYDPTLLSTIAGIYAKSRNKDYFDFFKSNLTTIDPFSSFSFYKSYEELLLLLGTDFDKLETAQILKNIIINRDQNAYRRMAALRTMQSIWSDAKRTAESESGTPLNQEQFEKLDKIAEFLVRNMEDSRAQNMAKSMFGK
jgi:aminopeptidase N